MMKSKFNRILLKLSGEALQGEYEFGISNKRLQQYSEEIHKIFKLGVEIAIVIGGGNIFRGKEATDLGIEKMQGDYMGMLATIINGMALQSSLENLGMETRLMSGLRMDQVCEPYIRRKALNHLKRKRIVIFGGGMGSPNFTTDSCASQRANEISADILLKGTRVDGVYNEDPEKNPNAIKYNTLSFQEAYNKRLNIMDMTAFTMCEGNNMPIIVFDMNKVDNLHKIILGEKIGTLITN